MSDKVIFTRYEDGQYPVKCLGKGKGYDLCLSDTDIQHFKNAHQLLIRVTGHPQARNWTFDRYFRLGKWARVEADPALDLLGFLASSAKTAKLDIRVEKLGIDLARRHKEVTKLFYKGFARQVAASGYDPQDVLQEIYKGILIRNNGTCPWDEKKSKFGHYVYMICDCVIKNYHKKQNHISSNERYGFDTMSDDDGGMETYIEDTKVKQPDFVLDDILRQVKSKKFEKEIKEMVPLLIEGYSKEAISELTGIPRQSINKAFALLKDSLSTR
jgi:DNA-directed RNA polymerase specialized sigma24 family protein